MKSLIATRRLMLLLLLVLLFVLPAVTLAETLQKVPKERMQIEPVEGLAYQEKFQDGYCHLVIDDDATNWEKILLHRGAGSEVLLMCTIQAPEWATQSASITGNIWDTDEEILQELQYANFNSGTQSNVSRAIAVYTEEKQLLSPVKTNGGISPFIHAVHWSDGKDRHLYEVVELEFEHTSPLGRKITLPKLGASLVKTNTTNIPGVTASLTDGSLIYSYDPELLGSDRPDAVLTQLQAPAGAAFMHGYYEYGGYLYCTVTDGFATVYTELYDLFENEIFTGTNSENMSIVWYDENQRIVAESGIFSITRINEKHNQPWMYYVQQDIQNGLIETDVPWKPARITKTDVVVGYDIDGRLVDSPYFQKTLDPTSSHVHISQKEGTEITIEAAQKMSRCAINYFVQPPEGARSYSWTRNTRNYFFGRQTHAYTNEVDRLLRKTRMPVDNGMPVHRGNGMFDRLNTTIKDVILYSMGLETKIDHGAAYLFCWFDENGNPMEISYIAETADRLLLEPETKSYASEDQIKHPVKGPVFIDSKNTGWKLRAEYHVQEGGNAYIVELHMEDKHGNPVYDFGGEKLVFYLPYREHEDFDNCDFYLMHYEGGNLNNGLPVNVTKTENGLRFEVDNLSPFVVSWEEAETLIVDEILESRSSDPTIEAARCWTLREPTPGIREASPLYNSSAALDTALQIYLKSEMPEATGMVTFELIPVRISGSSCHAIEPDEFPADGLDVCIPFTDGIPADAQRYLAAHMLAYDTADRWAGTIEKPEILQITGEGMWIHLNSMSPVGIGWVRPTSAEDDSAPSPSPEPVPTPSPAPAVPQTGDPTPFGALISLLFLSAAGSILILSRRKAIR